MTAPEQEGTGNWIDFPFYQSMYKYALWINNLQYPELQCCRNKANTGRTIQKVCFEQSDCHRKKT